MTTAPLRPIPSGIRGVSAERRAPRLAKIRLGTQVPNRNGNGTHPEMSPHFVFDDDAVGRQLLTMLGAECTEIPIAFPSDDSTEFARRNLEMWGAGTLKCRGSGIEAQALVNLAEYAEYEGQDDRTSPPLALWASTARAGAQQRQSGPEPERRMITCLGLGYDGLPPCPQLSADNCKATMHLQFLVRGFPGLGVFQVDTGSVVNIQRLDDFLAYLGGFTDQRFAMVPLVMRLEPYEMRGRKFYGLTFAVDFAAMQAAGVGALPEVGTLSVTQRLVRYLPEESQHPVALLPAGHDVEDEAPDDAIEVEAEPFPEVLEEAAGEPDAPPVDEAEPEAVVSMVLDGGAVSRDVWTWVAELLQSIATKHFEGDWEQVYGAFGGHPEAAPFFQRTRSRRPFIDPRGRTDDEAHALGALLQGWLNVQHGPTAPRRAPAKTVDTTRDTPRPPQARSDSGDADKKVDTEAPVTPYADSRLGAFRNVGEFYVRAGKELGLKADRVREIAGVPANSLPNLIVTYEGEAGAGLDALWLACATEAAGVEVEADA